MYRPGPYFALVVMLIPVAVTLAGVALSFNNGRGIPIWLPFALLLWFPCLLLVRLGLLSVRADRAGIAAGRPWGKWQYVAWEHIERVEKRGPLIRILGSSGVSVVFLPSLLRDGDRLTRRLLLRLPTHVLSEALSQEANQILTTSIFTMPEGGLSGLLRARPKVVFRLLALGGVIAGVALAMLALAAVPGALGAILAVICGVVALLSVAVSAWLAQELQVDDKGLTMVGGLTRRTRWMPWTQIELVEHSNHEALLRIHGEQRIVCVGPGLLSPAHRDLLRAFLHEYCRNRDVPIVKRHFLA